MKPRQMQNEAHPDYLGWQMDWPLFVKSPILRVNNKVFSRGDYFPWAEMKIEAKKVAHFYNRKLVHHNAIKATETGEGDRLGEMSQRQIKTLVLRMNTEMKKVHCATEEQFKRLRCRQSTVLDTQRRYVRQFLARNPYMSDFFIENRNDILKEPEPQEG